jgi:hypothetical protein
MIGKPPIPFHRTQLQAAQPDESLLTTASRMLVGLRMSSADEELGIASHLTTQGSVSFFRAERTTILFGREGDDKYRKLCQITFNRHTGALYAQFTYFRTEPGVIGLVTTSIDLEGRAIVTWESGGKVSTNLVKYSHPPDGNAHFSQDGSHKTQFWNQSLDLRNDEGHLFEIHAFHLEPFEYLLKNDVPTKSRLFLPFQIAGLPPGVALACEWRSLNSLEEYAVRIGSTIGPVALVPRRNDMKPYKAALLAPPLASPIKDRVLLVNVHPLASLPNVTSPVLFFMGGWRKQDSLAPGTTASFLAFSYPVGNAEEMAQTLGKSDFV